MICGSSQANLESNLVKSALQFEIKDGLNDMQYFSKKVVGIRDPDGYAPIQFDPNSIYFTEPWNMIDKEVINKQWDFLMPGDCVIMTKVAPDLYYLDIYSNGKGNFPWLIERQERTILKLFMGY